MTPEPRDRRLTPNPTARRASLPATRRQYRRTRSPESAAVMLCEKCSKIHFRLLLECNDISAAQQKHLAGAHPMMVGPALNQRPGDNSRMLIYLHHKSNHALKASAAQDCPLCELIWREFSETVHGWYDLATPAGAEVWENSIYITRLFDIDKPKGWRTCNIYCGTHQIAVYFADTCLRGTLRKNNLGSPQDESNLGLLSLRGNTSGTRDKVWLLQRLSGPGMPSITTLLH